jgi:hypothetical protein
MLQELRWFLVGCLQTLLLLILWKKVFASVPGSDPTISDGKSLSVINNNGKIYVLTGFDAGFQILYPFLCQRKGRLCCLRPFIESFTHFQREVFPGTYDDKGSNEENARINAALNTTLEDWNALTSIKGLTLSVHYSSGTPTADCSYGGWIRMGSNSNYQATGDHYA